MKDEKSRRQMHERLLVDQPVPEADQWIQESSRWRSSAKDSRPGADSSRCPELCFGLVVEPPEFNQAFLTTNHFKFRSKSFSANETRCSLRDEVKLAHALDNPTLNYDSITSYALLKSQPPVRSS